MNATATSESTPTAETPLTRQEKEKLLTKMYFRQDWIELIRLFGYQTLPMEQARQAIKPLAEKFGKESMAAACEILVEISTPGKEPVARLKPHIRRLPWTPITLFGIVSQGFSDISGNRTPVWSSRRRFICATCRIGCFFVFMRTSKSR